MNRILVFALTAGLALAQKPSAEALFREALLKERAEGNLSEAIFRYERIVADFPKERQVVAQALYQLGRAYEKLGEPRAQVIFSRLASEFTGIEPFASRARARLLALQGSAGDAPFAETTLDRQFELGSPNGKFVIYHQDNEWGRLWLKDLENGQETLLVDHPGGQVSNFAFSPDSRQLAYNHNDASRKINVIRTVPLDGGASASIGIRGYPVAWTGRDEILYYRPNYPAGAVDYYLVSARGGEPRKIHALPSGAGYGTAITPSGDALIVSQDKKLHWVDLASGESRPLTNGTGEETRPVISPDGKLVAFAANNEGKWALLVAPLDQGVPVRESVKLIDLEQPGLGAYLKDYWTSEGLLAVGISKSESNLFRLDVNPVTGRAVGAPVRLTQDNPQNVLASVSPDSRRIAYWYVNGMKRGFAVMDASGANERPLYDQSQVLDLFWESPDQILFYNFKTGGEKAAIYSLNINTGALQRVAQVEGLYWQYVPGLRENFHYYPGGGGPRPGAAIKAFSLSEGKDRLVAAVDYLSRVAVAPDQMRLAYSIIQGPDEAAPGPCEVGLMSVTGEKQSLVTSECTLSLAWSPDARYLLSRPLSGGLSVTDTATGESWPLHPETGGTDWKFANWSPDGTFVVLTRSTGGMERLAWEGVTPGAVERLAKR